MKINKFCFCAFACLMMLGYACYPSKPVSYNKTSTNTVSKTTTNSSTNSTTKPSTNTNTTNKTTTNTNTNTSTNSNTNTNNSAEYKKYSTTFGITLKGNEDLALLKEMSEWLGTPYKYASAVKGVGTDCSGFVTSCYKNVYNVKLQRSSYMIINDVKEIDRKNLQFGDILFFADNGGKGKIYHVGIYIGESKFVHARTTKNIGVVVSSINESYYNSVFKCGGRVPNVKTLK